MALSPSVVSITVLVVVLCLSCIVKAIAAKPRSDMTRLRYKRIDLFNATEHAFLIALRNRAPPHVAVLAKVRVADILAPRHHDVPAFNRIQRKHVDFVLYNLQSRVVLRAIELDGPAHASKRMIKSDQVKNSCFASAGVPLTRVPVADWNKPETLHALFEPSAAGHDDHVVGSGRAAAAGTRGGAGLREAASIVAPAARGTERLHPARPTTASARPATAATAVGTRPGAGATRS